MSLSLEITMEKLDPRTTALVLVDLQKGIHSYARGPHTAAQVVASGTALARRFRELGAPVVLVRVGWSADFGDALRQPVDQQTPAAALPADWMDLPEELNVAPTDILVTKRQWGAFYGTELDLQLRRRGIETIVMGGITTNNGVESTARTAWELGYAQVFAEDAMSAASNEFHRFSVDNILPRLGRVRSTKEILAAL
jgi:nicotinamidase-related amidase